jgi:hypothetical protein
MGWYLFAQHVDWQSNPNASDERRGIERKREEKGFEFPAEAACVLCAYVPSPISLHLHTGDVHRFLLRLDSRQIFNSTTCCPEISTLLGASSKHCAPDCLVCG